LLDAESELERREMLATRRKKRAATKAALSVSFAGGLLSAGRLLRLIALGL
jgi:hypothetical protein